MRMFSSWLKPIIVPLCLFVFTQAAHSDNLDLKRGVLSAGGTMGFTFVKPDGLTFDNMAYGFGGLVRVGFFLADNWEVSPIAGLNLQFSNPLAANTGFWLNSFQFGVGTNYYFDTDSMVRPYVGLDVQAKGNMPISPVIWQMLVTPRVGALLALSCNVALDLGLSADLGWQLSSAASSSGYDQAIPGINATIGYFGVKAFF